MFSMVRASKFLVLIAGLLGLAGMFHPFIIGTTDDGYSADASAWSLLGDVAQAQEDAAAQTDRFSTALAEAEAFGAYLWLPFLFPVFLAALSLTFLGTWGVLRGRFGRLFGLLSLGPGLFVLGFALLLITSASDGQASNSTGLGAILLLGTGIGACVGGFVSLVKPDRP